MIRTRQIFAIAALTLLAACTNDEINNKDKTSGPEAQHVTFTAVDDAVSTRTMVVPGSHSKGGGAKIVWSAGDKIWVKDAGNTWKQSAAGTFSSDKKHGVFLLTGTFQDGCAIHYTGINGSAGNKVTIQTSQTQATPNDFTHLGESGDCGIGTGKGKGSAFRFTIDHRSAYLCFLPRTSNKFVKRSRLFKIEVSSEDAIAGDYDFSGNNLSAAPIDHSSNKIELSTGGTTGFELTNANTDMAKNASYMVIAPGSHKLTIRYWLRNKVDNPNGTIEGTVTKYVDVNCKPGKICDITALLDPQDFTTSKYYMWDAKQHYWYGKESSQPKVSTIISTDNPKSAAADPDRWYNTGSNAWATNTANTCATANQILWYVQKGAPHWDATELWSILDHLYKGGMWLKTKKVLGQENGKTNLQMYEKAPDGIDYRAINALQPEYIHSNSVIIQHRPLKAEIGNYFYLPAAGFYSGGQLQHVSRYGYYWSSTRPIFTGYGEAQAYCMAFVSNSISFGRTNRTFGIMIDLKY